MPGKLHLIFSLVVHGTVGLLLFLVEGVHSRTESAPGAQRQAVATETIEVAEQLATGEEAFSKPRPDSASAPVEPAISEGDELSRTRYSGAPSEADNTSLAGATNAGRADNAEANGSTSPSTPALPPPQDTVQEPVQTDPASFAETDVTKLVAPGERVDALEGAPRSMPPLQVARDSGDSHSEVTGIERQQPGGEVVQVRTASRAAGGPEPVATSDFLEAEGVGVPNFQFEDFSLVQMNEIVNGGQAVFIVFCGSKMFAVSGPLSDPAGLTLVGANQLTRLSLRAVAVPRRSCGGVFDMLRFKYGVPQEDLENTHVRLLMTNALDALILERQREAARQLTCSLQELQVTAGVLRFEGRRVIDFEINRVVLQDGSTLAIDGWQASGEIR